MSEKNKESMKQTGEEEVKQKGETKSTIDNSKDITVDTVSPSSSNKMVVKKEKLAPAVLTESELKTLDYTDFSTPARMLELGHVLAKSQLVPLTKAEDVVVALMTGKELGLPFITSVSQIYPINGRPTLGVHIQKALLLKVGIIFEKIEDAVAIYEFYKADKDGSTLLKEVLTKENTKVKVPVLTLGKGTLEEQPSESTKRQVDTRTTYKFTREIKLPSGKYKEITAKGSFTISEATEADLVSKDVWKKYWRRMLDTRAFTNGAREIADDILLGIMTPNELSTDFYVNETGEEVHNATVVA